MEDNEGVEEAKEEMKLGKLQFSLDYDFQKGEVNQLSFVLFGYHSLKTLFTLFMKASAEQDHSKFTVYVTRMITIITLRPWTLIRPLAGAYCVTEFFHSNQSSDLSKVVPYRVDILQVL